LTRGTGGELFEEELAAPPKRNSSPPSKQPEYLAAPLLKIPRCPPHNRNASPPPCWKFLAALAAPFSAKNAENPGGLSLESFSGPWYGRSQLMAAKCP